jgi:hypothetical protein
MSAPRGKRPKAPLPSANARANAKVVALAANEVESVGAAARALPDPSELEAGTLVIVSDEVRAERSLVSSVLGVLGRKKSVSRAIRCSALVARGYTGVGGSVDPDTRADVVWGYVAAKATKTGER